MTPSGAQEPFDLKVRGGTVSVRILGNGPSVLLVHGISADHSEWIRVAEGLARDHRVILPDLLGRGASRPEADADFSLAAETDRLLEILEAVEAGKTLLGGHSAGASLALSLARRIPVAGLLLVSPVTPWTPRPRILGALRYPSVRRLVEPVLRVCRRPLTRYILTRRVYGENHPSIADAVRRYAEPYVAPERGRALLRILSAWDPGELADLAGPTGVETRVLTGGADRRISPGHAGRWAAALDAPCEVVPGAGHGLTEEQPERIEAALRDIEAAREAKPEPRDR